MGSVGKKQYAAIVKKSSIKLGKFF